MSTAALESPVLLRQLRLLPVAIACELRRHSAFRLGFLVREVLRGVERPILMSFVYAALFASGATLPAGYDFPGIVRFLILVAVIQKLLVHDRVLDLSREIFEGYVTKYTVMPVRYFTLVVARWVQFTLVQALVVVGFWLAGAALLPQWWPIPTSVLALGQCCVLVLLASYCFLLLYFILNVCAFWVDVTWTLIAMARMGLGFLSGEFVPVSLMPPVLRDIFVWLFPYWALTGPIEIALGHPTAPDFGTGLIVLSCWIVVLQVLALFLWRRGLRSYAGVGM